MLHSVAFSYVAFSLRNFFTSNVAETHSWAYCRRPKSIEFLSNNAPVDNLLAGQQLTQTETSCKYIAHSCVVIAQYCAIFFTSVVQSGEVRRRAYGHA